MMRRFQLKYVSRDGQQIATFLAIKTCRINGRNINVTSNIPYISLSLIIGSVKKQNFR
jgi:hypothetical protein